MTNKKKGKPDPSLSRTYVRDKRSPTPKSETVSRVMSAIKGKNTSPELILRKALREAGMSGYRLHWNVPGKPDIAYPGKKLAIFVHGCYWHRCPHCNPSTPKTNTEFWVNKFQKNVERDARKKNTLEKSGWKVLVFWECEVKEESTAVVETIKVILTPKKTSNG